MRYTQARSAAFAIALTALAACSTGIPVRQDPEEVRNHYEAYAGAAVDHFTWFGHFDGWEALSADELVLFTSANHAYLLKVSPPCHDLRGAARVGFTSTGGSVYARLDSVTTRDWRCRILGIRKLDYRRMKADLRRARQQQPR
ncbi:MAG TPA: DUF6491 family protein [Steroidobacteraceae bacterium]